MRVLTMALAALGALGPALARAQALLPNGVAGQGFVDAATSFDAPDAQQYARRDQSHPREPLGGRGENLRQGGGGKRGACGGRALLEGVCGEQDGRFKQSAGELRGVAQPVCGQHVDRRLRGAGDRVGGEEAASRCSRSSSRATS